MLCWKKEKLIIQIHNLKTNRLLKLFEGVIYVNLKYIIIKISHLVPPLAKTNTFLCSTQIGIEHYLNNSISFM